MKIKKGDTVQVIAGKDKGRKGKILKALPKESRVVVEGMNMRKKHVKARKAGEKGQTLSMPFPFDASNVLLACPHCGKATRVGYVVEGKEKRRMCKKCKGVIS
ncbi:MAG: 50S ribosomal protein L24 [Candidatus Wildermuthbacteria bacterium]|nr:50S ribosomal protein L24 [Candidatus Wildermuthbacteria bacterium]